MRLKNIGLVIFLVFFSISLILLTISSGYKVYIMIGTGAFILFSVALILNEFKNK